MFLLGLLSFVLLSKLSLADVVESTQIPDDDWEEFSVEWAESDTDDNGEELIVNMNDSEYVVKYNKFDVVRTNMGLQFKGIGEFEVGTMFGGEIPIVIKAEVFAPNNGVVSSLTMTDNKAKLLCNQSPIVGPYGVFCGKELYPIFEEDDDVSDNTDENTVEEDENEDIQTLEINADGSVADDGSDATEDNNDDTEDNSDDTENDSEPTEDDVVRSYLSRFNTGQLQLLLEHSRISEEVRSAVKDLKAAVDRIDSLLEEADGILMSIPGVEGSPIGEQAI